MPRIGFYSGSFDPVTNGHTDVMRRALALVDKLVIGIGVHPGKTPLFSVAERVEMLTELVAGEERVRVETFSGLLVDFMDRIGARVILRGIRALSDFDYEFQLALMNRHLNPRIETVFMMPKEEYSYVSSRLLKEVSRFGAEVDGLLPSSVISRLHEKQGRGPSTKKTRGPGPEEAL